MTIKQPNFDWLKKAFFEAALIVFAVVLGFIVNEWRQEYREHQNAKSALLRIKEEIESNRSALIKWQKYHQEVSARYEKLIKSPPSTPIIETFFQAAPKGLGSLVIRNDAWVTAQARGVLDSLDFEKVEAIGRAYKASKVGVEASIARLLEQISAKESFLPDTDGAALLHLSFSFQNLVSQEKSLVFYYNEALKAIEQQL